MGTMTTLAQFAQEELLREVSSLQRLSGLYTRAADAAATLSMETLTVAKEEPQAQALGTELLQQAERHLAAAKSLSAEAEALWRKVGC